MKRCIEEHTVPSFGTIPVGSLWADDSPYVTDEAKFEAADAAKPNKQRKPKGDD